MLHSISWGRYCTALVLLLGIYYGYVFWKYYRHELFAKRDHAASEESPDDEMLPDVQSLNDEIAAYVRQAAMTHAVKPEILFALQRIIRKYPAVKDSPYQQSVNRLLRMECRDQCALHLDETELKQVWMV